jgi:hypothetical protein
MKLNRIERNNYLKGTKLKFFSISASLGLTLLSVGLGATIL